jgi:hypothetical protein
MNIARPLLPAALLVSVSVWSHPMSAQEPLSPNQLLSAPGQVVASHRDAVPDRTTRGVASRPNAGPEVVGYAIERVDLGAPKQLEGAGATRGLVTATRAWRVRVYANNLQVRSAPISVWIGDKLVGRGVESEDLSSVVAVTTDGSIVENGQPVSLSYQSDPDQKLVAKAPIKMDSKQ